MFPSILIIEAKSVSDLLQLGSKRDYRDVATLGNQQISVRQVLVYLEYRLIFLERSFKEQDFSRSK